MYASIFLIAVYVADPSQPDQQEEFFVTDADIRNFLVFVGFWTGVYRNSQEYSELTEHSVFLHNYWPFFVFLLILTFERVSLMWLHDRIGTTPELVKVFERVTREYN